MKKLLAILLLSGCLPAMAQQSWLSESKESQKSVTGHNQKVQPAQSQKASGNTTNKLAVSELQQRKLSIRDHEFWLYDAWVTLVRDIDADGYYSSLKLEFDADTIYQHADVYARLYLQRGDTLYEYHVTSVFHIDGESEGDSLIVETDLLEGFPGYDYHIVIELYDADTDGLVAVRSDIEDADLTLVPLESRDNEFIPETVVVVTEEHGGSLGFVVLLLTLGVVLRKRR